VIKSPATAACRKINTTLLRQYTRNPNSRFATRVRYLRQPSHPISQQFSGGLSRSGHNSPSLQGPLRGTSAASDAASLPLWRCREQPAASAVRPARFWRALLPQAGSGHDFSGCV
jgi:hypothetical protein